jgi:hypothetical protein
LDRASSGALATACSFAYDLDRDPFQLDPLADPGAADPLMRALREWDAETPWMADAGRDQRVMRSR